MHGDLCETFLVGVVDEQGQRLLESSQRCLDAAVNICKPGVRFSWIGNSHEACILGPKCHIINFLQT